MTVYLDASILVALFTDNPFSGRADDILRSSDHVPVVSDFAAAEFASALGLRVRTARLTETEAREAFGDFDAWTAQSVLKTEAQASDIAVATAFLRRLDLTLRAPDAVNIAIAQRLESSLVTFDAKMSASARALGVTIIGD